MTLGEFTDRCDKLCAELAKLLEEFDDISDPAGVSGAVLARYLAYYLDPVVIEAIK